ncbi:MAG: hypothetical protein WC465_04745 [Patescibacteria group bacterium]
MFKSKKLSTMWSQIKRHNTLWAVLIVVFWMFGLALSNFANNQNLERSELNRNVRLAEDQSRILDAQVSELQAMDRIETESQRLNLVKVDSRDIIYLKISDDKVALK